MLTCVIIISGLITDKSMVKYIIILYLSYDLIKPENFGILMSVMEKLLLMWGNTIKTRLTITVNPVNSNENLIKGDLLIANAIFFNN